MQYADVTHIIFSGSSVGMRLHVTVLEPPTDEALDWANGNLQPCVSQPSEFAMQLSCPVIATGDIH